MLLSPLTPSTGKEEVLPKDFPLLLCLTTIVIVHYQLKRDEFRGDRVLCVVCCVLCVGCCEPNKSALNQNRSKSRLSLPVVGKIGDSGKIGDFGIVRDLLLSRRQRLSDDAKI